MLFNPKNYLSNIGMQIMLCDIRNKMSGSYNPVY